MKLRLAISSIAVLGTLTVAATADAATLAVQPASACYRDESQPVLFGGGFNGRRDSMGLDPLIGSAEKGVG